MMFDVILSAAKNLLIYRDSSPPNGCQVQNDIDANIMFAKVVYGIIMMRSI